MNPWDARNDGPESFSPDGSRRIVYRDMSEIAMGGPEGGDCLVLEKGGTAVYLGGWCGCPAVWSPDGRYVALPFWTRNRGQRLAVADLERMELRLSEEIFAVLCLTGIEDGKILGIDSPLVRTEDVARGVDSFFWLRKRPLYRVPWPYLDFDGEIRMWSEYGTPGCERDALEEQDNATREWYAPTEVWTENPVLAEKSGQVEKWRGSPAAAVLFGLPLLLLFAVLALVVWVLTALYALVRLLLGRRMAPPHAFRNRLEEGLTTAVAAVFNPVLRLFRRMRQ